VAVRFRGQRFGGAARTASGFGEPILSVARGSHCLIDRIYSGIQYAEMRTGSNLAHVFTETYQSKGLVMSDTGTKCAHPACQCEVSSSEKYCSQFCKDAGADEIEIACDCGHPVCEAAING
jgi:hypothetical protein